MSVPAGMYENPGAPLMISLVRSPQVCGRSKSLQACPHQWCGGNEGLSLSSLSMIKAKFASPHKAKMLRTELSMLVMMGGKACWLFECRLAPHSD